MEEYLKENYKPSIKDLINNNSVPAVLIISWMLSSLVRYKLKVWQEICAGEEDELITKIQEFRRSAFPKAVKNLFW